MLFTHEYITNRIIRIKDISLTAMYLVIGDHTTALLDTGIGIGNVREYIRNEIGKEVDLLILTHGHLDHASGAILFKDIPVYLNELDRDLMNRHVFDILSHVTYTEDMYRRLNMVCPEYSQADILEGYDSCHTLPLEDGDAFDLGGITLEAIHTPGHTQGMTMILFKEERIILFGDACGVGVLLVEDCCSTVEVYRNTLIHVKSYEGEYDRIIRNHGTCESPLSLLQNVIDVCADILNGTDDHIPSSAPIATDYPVFMAKETLPGTQTRVDGKEGNIIYAANKIR
ncbi:MAG: MBL fold metallo-hydrolase [Solobacterium sp.]|nr:MBL fold metallo-hydrolase [Solobacterium sp.]